MSLGKQQPDRTFRWSGKPRFKTALVYSVLVTPVSPTKNQFRNDLLKQSHRNSIAYLKTLFNLDYTVYKDDRQRQNDRVWQRILRYPPTHRVDILAHIPRRKERIVFTALVNLLGFRWTPHYCGIAIGRFIAGFVQGYKYNYLLVQCPDTDQWYWQLILARCRELLKTEAF